MSRIRRLEFTKPVKLEMFKRAGGPGNVCCEGCGLALKGKPFEYDHTIEEWEQEDVAHALRKPLTAEDGKLLGRCCHKPKSALKTSQRAHVVRVVEKAAKVKKPSRPMAGSRASGWKAKIGGGWVRRDAE